MAILHCTGFSQEKPNTVPVVSGPDLKDSTIKEDKQILTDPKSGFRDLFVQNNENGPDMTQLHPMALKYVEDYMKKYGKGLEKLKDWGRPYFDMMDAILVMHGIPREMKYLAVIESYLKTYAVSWAGAVGPWQFMPSTARRMGLKVSSYYDERTDYYKSTHAAARYLTELFGIYGDWLLVIAAYNGGPGNVNAAIRKSGSRNFWQLQNYLPAESREHVKKFIATHYIMEGEGGITTLTKDEATRLVLESAKGSASRNLSEAELANSKQLLVSGKYNSLVIIKYIVFDILEFSRYNPDFDKQISLNGEYEMRLPVDKMDLFLSRKQQILNESYQVLLDNFKQSLEQPVKNTPAKKS